MTLKAENSEGKHDDDNTAHSFFLNSHALHICVTLALCVDVDDAVKHDGMRYDDYAVRRRESTEFIPWKMKHSVAKMTFLNQIL